MEAAHQSRMNPPSKILEGSQSTGSTSTCNQIYSPLSAEGFIDFAMLNLIFEWISRAIRYHMPVKLFPNPSLEFAIKSLCSDLEGIRFHEQSRKQTLCQMECLRRSISEVREVFDQNGIKYALVALREWIRVVKDPSKIELQHFNILILRFFEIFYKWYSTREQWKPFTDVFAELKAAVREVQLRGKLCALEKALVQLRELQGAYISNGYLRADLQAFCRFLGKMKELITIGIELQCDDLEDQDDDNTTISL